MRIKLNNLKKITIVLLIPILVLSCFELFDSDEKNSKNVYEYIVDEVGQTKADALRDALGEDNLEDFGDSIDDIDKLITIINIDSYQLVIDLLKVMIIDANNVNSSIYNFSCLLNNINTLNIAKLTDFLISLNGTENQLMADLLAPYSGISQGIGCSNMAILITNLSSNDTSPADEIIDSSADLATFFKGLNDNLTNESISVSLREGSVRFIEYGAIYSTINFPGISPEHLAVIMNSESDPADMVNLLNSNGVSNNIPIIGCGDRVNDTNSDHILDDPTGPDFLTPCTSAGMGW
jgi:hypothetical protein